MLLLSTIDLKILRPAPDQKISLHAITALKSMTNKILFFDKYNNKYSWCTTCKCTCIKTIFKYGVAYHRRGDKDNLKYYNLNITYLRWLRSLQVRDRNNKRKSSKK